MERNDGRAQLVDERISRLKRPTNVLVEFLTTEEEYAQAQRNIRAVAQKVGVKVL